MRYKVDAGDLRVGMYVAELDRPWLGTPFLFQGFLIESREDLEQLKAICVYVLVDELKSQVTVAGVGKPVDDNATEASGKPPVPGKPAHSPALADNANRLTTTHATAQQSVGQLLSNATEGGSIDISESQTIVERLVRQSANLNVIMQLANIRQKHDWNTTHALNTAIFAIAFARHLGHSEDRLRLIGLGAILHDIGKTRVPAEILNKPGKLMDAELAILKRHPADGYEMLKNSSNVPDEVLEIIRCHHERINGSGYPHGLRGDELPVSVCITAVADAYETLTADKPYQAAIMPVDALQRLRASGAEEFGQELIQEFVRFIGLYPIGSLVKLNSGEIAVVISSDPKKRLRPMIMMIRDGQGMNVHPRRLINLAALPEEKLSINTIIDPKQHGLDISMLLAEALNH